MVKVTQLKKRRKDKFLKEAAALANKYSKIINYHTSSNFNKFANACFNLVEEYTCDCSKERDKNWKKKYMDLLNSNVKEQK